MHVYVVYEAPNCEYLKIAPKPFKMRQFKMKILKMLFEPKILNMKINMRE